MDTFATGHVSLVRVEAHGETAEAVEALMRAAVLRMIPKGVVGDVRSEVIEADTSGGVPGPAIGYPAPGAVRDEWTGNGFKGRLVVGFAVDEDHALTRDRLERE